MKQKIYILGLVNTIIIFLGTMLKVNHLAGANILLTIGIVTLVLVFLPLALRNCYMKESDRKSRLLYFVTWLTCLVVFTGMLFKVMHWPLAGYFLLLALPFPYVVFLPVFLVVTGRNKNSSINNTVFMLFLLAVVSVFSVLLALNVSKERIVESYNLSRNYIGAERILKEMPLKNGNSEVNDKIDQVLKTIDEYQSLILKQEGLTSEQWHTNPGDLLRPDAMQSAFEAITKMGEPFPGDNLEIGLRDLINVLSKTPGCEELAKNASDIFDYRGTGHDESPAKFENISLSWALIYLDGLRSSLYTIKTSLPVVD